MDGDSEALLAQPPSKQQRAAKRTFISRRRVRLTLNWTKSLRLYCECFSSISVRSLGRGNCEVFDLLHRVSIPDQNSAASPNENAPHGWRIRNRRRLHEAQLPRARAFRSPASLSTQDENDACCSRDLRAFSPCSRIRLRFERQRLHLCRGGLSPRQRGCRLKLPARRRRPTLAHFIELFVPFVDPSNGIVPAQPCATGPTDRADSWIARIFPQPLSPENPCHPRNPVIRG
jgi:hypothetical protein